MDLITYINNLPNIFLENILAQTIWIIAFFISSYNFLFCKDRRFIIFTAIASFFWWIHFLLLWFASEEILFFWLLSAWLVNFFDIFKNLISLKYEKNLKLVLWITAIYIIIWIFTYNWYISIIPTLTAIISTYLVFFVRWIYLNLGFLFIIVLWMIFNYISNSIWWLMTDIFLFFFWLFWIYKIWKGK